MTKLRFLDLSDTKVTDLGPLGGLRKLKELRLRNLEIVELSSLIHIGQPSVFGFERQQC